MIKFVCILFLASTSFISGCDSSDSKISESIMIYQLQKITGGFAGVTHELGAYDIQWIFNAERKTILVEKNQTVDHSIPYHGLEEGRYTYAVVENKKGKFLQINGEYWGGINAFTESLIIDQNKHPDVMKADHYVLHFGRVN